MTFLAFSHCYWGKTGPREPCNILCSLHLLKHWFSIGHTSLPSPQALPQNNISLCKVVEVSTSNPKEEQSVIKGKKKKRKKTQKPKNRQPCFAAEVLMWGLTAVMQSLSWLLLQGMRSIYLVCPVKGGAENTGYGKDFTWTPSTALGFWEWVSGALWTWNWMRNGWCAYYWAIKNFLKEACDPQKSENYLSRILVRMHGHGGRWLQLPVWSTSITASQYYRALQVPFLSYR